MRALYAICVLSITLAVPLSANAAPTPSFWSFLQPQKAPNAQRVIRHASHHRHRDSGRVVRRHSSEPDSYTAGGGSVIEAARSQIGNGAVYGRRNLWCARFMNYVLAKAGYRGTGSDWAKSFASMPHTDQHVGAIAVMGRRGGGHVGVVSGVAANGNPIIISGNNGGRVREAEYPRGRVLAYVVPR